MNERLFVVTGEPDIKSDVHHVIVGSFWAEDETQAQIIFESAYPSYNVTKIDVISD